MKDQTYVKASNTVSNMKMCGLGWKKKSVLNMGGKKNLNAWGEGGKGDIYHCKQDHSRMAMIGWCATLYTHPGLTDSSTTRAYVHYRGFHNTFP